MARIKFDNNNDKFVGKVGGQNISNTRNGFVLSNIGQPPKTAQPKQSTIRYETTRLSGIYRTLTTTEKQTWHNQAPNYPYVNAVGQSIQRRAFEVFKLLNRNRILISENILRTAPPFTPLVVPAITLTSVSSNNITLSATNTQSGQLYMIFIYQHNTVGASSIQPKPLLLYIATKAEMDQGINLLPHLLKGFPDLDFKRAITVRVSAIVKATGNRDKVGKVATAIINPNALGLDILSYYPFNNNAADYFDNNNAIYNGATFDTNGIINGRALFNNNPNSYINLGNNSTIDFNSTGYTRPFAYVLWVNSNDFGRNTIIDKSRHGGSERLSGYVLHPYTGRFSVGFGQSGFHAWCPFIQLNGSINNKETFIAFGYLGNNQFFIKTDTNYQTMTNQCGSTNGFSKSSQDLLLGITGWANALKFSGTIAELTIINDIVNNQQLELIRQANLNGQTILDIN